MAITTTNRLGLYRWSSDDDGILREHVDLSHGSIESYGAKIISGTTIPAVGSPQYARTFFIKTTDNSLYFYDSEDAFGQWIPINTNVILVTLAENKGDILVATGPDQWDILPVGTKNQVLTVLDNSSNVGWATLLINKGDLLSFNGTTLASRTVGSNNQSLFLDSAQSTGLSWGLIDTASIADSAGTTSKIAANAVESNKFTSLNVTGTKFAHGNITTSKIGDLAVTTGKILDLAIVGAKVADGGITEIKFADSSVTATKFAASSVIAEKIANLAVSSFEIAALSVTEAKLALLSVTSGKILNQNVITTHFADGSVTEQKLVDGAVTTVKIADGSVTGPKLADASIATSKINNTTIGAVQIAHGAITTPKILDINVTTEKIADSAVSTSKIADGAITSDKIQSLAVTGSKIALNAVTSLALRQSPGLSVIGNPTSTVSDVTNIVSASNNTILQRLSGTVAFSPLATGSIENNAITTVKLKDLTVVDADVSTTANINLAKLGPGTLPAAITTNTGNYINGSVTRSKLGPMGIWQTYVPVVYVAEVGLLGAFSYPGSIVSSSQYTVNSARYVQLNEWMLVNVRITLNANFSPKEDAVVSVTLPVVPALPNFSLIGEAYYENADTYRNGAPLKAMVNTVRNLALLKPGNGRTLQTQNEEVVDGVNIALHFQPAMEKYDILSISAQYPVAI